MALPTPALPISYPLFKKVYKLKVSADMTLGDAILTVTDLDIRFNIKKTLTKEANTGEITVFNFSDYTRSELSGIESGSVVLEAGYDGAERIIFAGDVREINSEQVGSNWKTTFKAGDGKRKIKKKRINRTIRGPVNLVSVLRTLAEGLDLPLSHGSEILLADPTIKLEFANREFTKGYTGHGKATKVLDALLESSGLEWSIQNGEMQILTRGRPLNDVDIVLTPSTGLLGSPKLSGDKVLSCSSLMIPEIAPGRVIKIESKFVEGRYRVQTAVYKGYTAGKAWDIDIEGEAL